MLPSCNDISELHYLLPSSSSSSATSSSFNIMNNHHGMIFHDQTSPATCQLNRFVMNFHSQHQIPAPPTMQLHHQPSSSSLSSNNSSTSDDQADEGLMIINERKQRRMISNRESARRSRMRKQKHLDELWSQVVWLRNENHQLIDKLNHVTESRDQVVQENSQLKEENVELRQMIGNIQLSSPFSTLRDLDDVVSL